MKDKTEEEKKIDRKWAQLSAVELREGQNQEEKRGERGLLSI